MNPVLIVKNCTREGPGILEFLLENFAIPSKIVDLERGEDFPSPKGFSALVILGGPNSANDKKKEIQHALIRIQEALSADIPYLGICLGLQLLVKAGGGTVVKNAVKEIGFRDPERKFFMVSLTPQGKADPLCDGLEASFNIFHLHGETVRLARNMTLLGTGLHCQNQIVRAGAHAYGIQGHLELTDELFKVWMRDDPDLARLSKIDLENDFRLLRKDIGNNGSRLFANFLVLAGLIDRAAEI